MDIKMKNITDMLQEYIDQEGDDGQHTAQLIDNMLLYIFEFLWGKKKDAEAQEIEDRADADFESHDY